MTSICLFNRQLEVQQFWANGGKTGGLSALPDRWKSHPNCEMCSTMERMILYVPSTPKSAQSADEKTQFAFTLTMPPDYVLKKPLTEVARMIMEYGLTNKPYEKATQYAYVLEHTDAGTPHIHGVYKTASGRRLSSKYFKRYHDLWDEKVKLGSGHKGGYHQKARHTESYEGYLEKEGVVLKSKPPV